MSTAFIIIMGLALGISGYCVGFYAGQERVMRALCDMLEKYMATHAKYQGNKDVPKEKEEE